MKQEELIQLLEQMAPPDIADSFDEGRIGMIIDLLYTKNRQVNKIAVALDVTTAVLKKAAAFEADILICHHTPLFHPVTAIPETLAKRMKIIFDNNISVYAMHTNYDHAEGGVNAVLADMLGLKDQIMTDFGIIGMIEQTPADVFAKNVSDKLNAPLVYAGDNPIQKVMICGGSCFNRHAMSVAREHKVDAFLSSEMKHSDVLRERGDMTIIDAGHYATENPAMRVLAEKLGKELAGQAEVLFIDDDPGLKSL